MVVHLVSGSTPINLGIGRDIDLVAYGSHNITLGRYGGVPKQRVNGFLAKLQGKRIYEEVKGCLSVVEIERIKSGFFEGVFLADGILSLAARMLLQQQTTQAYYKNMEISVKWPANFFLWIQQLVRGLDCGSAFALRRIYEEVKGCLSVVEIERIKSGFFEGVFLADGILSLAARMLLQQQTTQAYYKNMEISVKWPANFFLWIQQLYWQYVSASEAPSRYGVQKEGAVKSGFFEGVFLADGILSLAARMLLQQQTTQAYYKNMEISVKWPANFFLWIQQLELIYGGVLECWFMDSSTGSMFLHQKLHQVKSGFFEGVFLADGILSLAARMLLQQQTTQAYYKNMEISVKWPANFFLWIQQLVRGLDCGSAFAL
ncbi:unnamed protein product, partial [Ilex paraguariensis]